MINFILLISRQGKTRPGDVRDLLFPCRIGDPLKMISQVEEVVCALPRARSIQDHQRGRGLILLKIILFLMVSGCVR